MASLICNSRHTCAIVLPADCNFSVCSNFRTICSGVCFENFFITINLPTPNGVNTKDTQNNLSKNPHPLQVSVDSKKWQEAREYLFRSLHLHISPEWIEDLEELLRRNPLVRRPELESIDIACGEADGAGFDAAYHIFRWAQAKRYTETQVFALQEMFRDTTRRRKHFETISTFREWITLCSDYRGLKLWGLFEDDLFRYCLWYIWALCESPTTTAQDVEEAMTHFESVFLLAGDAEDSETLAIARILFAYRFGDLATVENQRPMRCHQKSTDGILLHDVESIYCIDAYTAVGDYEAVVAGIRESWGKRKIPRFLQAALLEAYLVTGREKRAAKWYEKLWRFSITRKFGIGASFQEEIAGECGILRYLLRLVERGEGGYRRDLRKRVLSVVSVWDKLFYPREMGKLAGVLAVAIRVGFDSDEVFPAVLSASGCEWVSVPDVDHPTAREAATWFEQIACQVEELFRPEKPIRVPQAGIYVSDWDVVREFFQEYFDAKTFGFYENPKANFRSNYLYFDYGEHQTLGYFNWSRFAIMQLPVPPNAEKAVTIEVNHRSRAEGIIARLRADGYPVLTELTQTDAGSYVAEVQGADNINITITARQ